MKDPRDDPATPPPPPEPTLAEAYIAARMVNPNRKELRAAMSKARRKKRAALRKAKLTNGSR